MTEAALLAAIHAAPDDEAPRRVLADYLIERGDPRGELINVQCELARADLTAARREELDRHASAVFRPALYAWFPREEPLHDEVTWRRGLIDAVRMVPQRAQLLRPRLALHPVRSLTITSSNFGLDALPDWPATVTALTVANAVRLSPAGAMEYLEAILASSIVSRLSALGVCNFNLGAAAPARIAEVAPATLRELDLSKNPGARGGLAALVERRGWTSLTLRDCALDDSAVATLVASPALTGVTRLDLAGNPLGEPAARALAASSHLDTLVTLDVSGCSFDDEARAILIDRFGTRTVHF